MRAIQRLANQVRVEACPLPEPAHGEVRIAVQAAGLCRTDVLAARGALAVAEGRILGHELAGVVDLVTPGCVDALGKPLRPGQRVTVDPALPCGRCHACTHPRPRLRCVAPGYLGVARDGGFAEAVLVPAQAVHPLPAGVSALEGLFAEPVAAALAVLEAPIDPQQRGLVVGSSRIAALVVQVLAARGFGDIEVLPSGVPLEADAYDFAIETALTPALLDDLSQAVRPGGLVVLKSRTLEAIPMLPARWVARQQRIHAVQYGSFDEAVALLGSRAVDVAALAGPCCNFEAFASLLREGDEPLATKPVLMVQAAEGAATDAP